MNSDYLDFLKEKEVIDSPSGFEILKSELNSILFPFQKDIVHWAIHRGRAAVWADCGLGKTLIQLEWAKFVCDRTGGKVLILAPLAVAQQTKIEGLKLGLDVEICQDMKDIRQGINITNYEKIHKFNLNDFTGVVLDESSILKHFTSVTRNLLINSCSKIPYKLCCTATPAPNDYMELGNHAEFLGVMSRLEMLSMFFVHDSGDTAKWRLKGHAENAFWQWLASWAVYMRKPSDLNYSDEEFNLPELNMVECILSTEKSKEDRGFFITSATTLDKRRSARKNSLPIRVKRIKELINNRPDESWLIWCDLNMESAGVNKALSGAKEIKGSDKEEYREKTMLDFSEGRLKYLVTKPSIAGFGLNWQHCHNVIFAGLSDSYESFYQAVRRCWRFGQKESVNVYVIISDREVSILHNIKRKQTDADNMSVGMLEHMKDFNEIELKGLKRNSTKYFPKCKMEVPKWMLK